ncbi:NIL domain-containing protein, partial [Acinetobacter radioresistens]|uniref:NIL domain-containing protein n=1 Tax=Acinetobacter radioresistens TaxID=40216 RepID=UPI00292A5684
FVLRTNMLQKQGFFSTLFLYRTQVILKLCYESAIHHTPDLKAILEQLNGPVHLYQGHVDTIQQHLIGSLIVAIPNVQLNLKHLKEALKQYIAHIEVLGYARPTH